MEEGKIVITGGSGFIMSHLAEKFAEAGREVVLFDNNEQNGLYEETKALLSSKRNLRFGQYFTLAPGI